MTTGARIGSAIIFLGLLCFAGYFLLKALFIIVPMVWGSWSANWTRVHANDAHVEMVRHKAEEQTFRQVCPDYFEASWIGRRWNFSDLSWCENYRDRM